MGIRNKTMVRAGLLAVAVVMILSRSLWSRPEMVGEDFSNGLGAWAVSTGGCGTATVQVATNGGPLGDAAVEWGGPGPASITIDNLPAKFDHVHESPSFAVAWDENWSTPELNENEEYDSVIETRITGEVHADGHWLPMQMSLQRGKVTSESVTYTGWVLTITVNNQQVYQNYGAATDDSFGVSGFDPFDSYYHYSWRRALDGKLSLTAAPWVSGSVSPTAVTIIDDISTSLIGQNLDLGGSIDHDAIRFTDLAIHVMHVAALQDNIEFLSLATEASPTLTLAFDNFQDQQDTSYPAWTHSENADIEVVSAGGLLGNAADYGVHIVSDDQTSAMHLDINDESYFKHHTAPSWTLQWDQKWSRPSGTSFVSTPYAKIGLTLSDDDSSQDVTLTVKQRMTYDYNTSTDQAEIVFTLTVGANEYLLSEQPVTGSVSQFEYYFRRLILSQDSADETCDILLNDILMDNSEVEDPPINLLAAQSLCPPGNFYLSLDSIKKIEVTGIEFGASLTDSPTEMYLDNVDLTVGNDWEHAHPDNFDHYVEVKSFYPGAYPSYSGGDASYAAHSAAAFDDALKYCTRIYVNLPPPKYRVLYQSEYRYDLRSRASQYLNSPVVINRVYPLFLVSPDKALFKLTAVDPEDGMTLFQIDSAPLVNFNNLTLDPYGQYGNSYALFAITGAKAIELPAGSSATRLELQDTDITQAMLSIDRASTTIMQGSGVAGGGKVNSPIVVNDEGALFYMIGGGVTNFYGSDGGLTMCLDEDLAPGATVCNTSRGEKFCCDVSTSSAAKDTTFLIRQIQGRVVVINTAGGVSNNIADFKIESASQIGATLESITALPHLFAGNRSEGNITGTRLIKSGETQNQCYTDHGPLTSRYVYIKGEGEELPEVVLKANHGSWSTCSLSTPHPDVNLHAFARLGSPAKLWLLGNASNDVGYLVDGNTAEDAQVFAYGNLFMGNSVPDSGNNRKFFYVYNQITGKYYVNLDADKGCVYTGLDETYVCPGHSCYWPENENYPDETCPVDLNETNPQCESGDGGNVILCPTDRVHDFTVTGCSRILNPYTWFTCPDVEVTYCRANGCNVDSKTYNFYNVWQNWDFDIVDDNACAHNSGTSDTTNDGGIWTHIFHCQNSNYLMDKPLGPEVKAQALSIQAGNIVEYGRLLENSIAPSSRLARPDDPVPDETQDPPRVSIGNYASLLGMDPSPPEIPLPEEITLKMPRMNFALPDMLDVTTAYPEYGLNDPVDAECIADPECTDDQGPAIQAYLDECRNHDTNEPTKYYGNMLFFPAGTYHVTQPLGFNHHTTYEIISSNLIGWQQASDGSVYESRIIGGWLAGAGSDVTTIVNDGDPAGPVLMSESMAAVNISGIHFQTTAVDDDPGLKFPNVQIDYENWNLDGVTGKRIGAATTNNKFYSCVFDGGTVAFGVGSNLYNFSEDYFTGTYDQYSNKIYYNPNTSQCDYHLAIDCTFTDAHFGFVKGHDNAVVNMPIDGTFTDNTYAFGTMGRGPFNVLRANVDSEVADFQIIEGTFYFYGINSTSPQVLNTYVPASNNNNFIVFDHGSFSPGNGEDPVFYFAGVGGTGIFLDSSLEGRTEGLGFSLVPNQYVETSLFKFNSDLGDWTDPDNVYINGWSGLYIGPHAQCFYDSSTGL